MTNSPSKRRWFQFSLRGLLALMTLIAIGLAVTWRLWPWWQERVLVSELRERALLAKDSAEAGEAYHALLQRDKRERAERLADDPDTSIGLKAAFELLADRTDGYAKLQPDKQHAFLQILEQKTRLTPPDWWAKGLQEVFPVHTGQFFGTRK